MSTVTRKRPRINPHQFAETPRASSSYDLINSVSSLDCATPTPLANTDYCLFGGLDTPGAWSEQRLERADELDAERDYRHTRFAEPLGTPRHDYGETVSGLKQEKEQEKTLPDQQYATSRNGWYIGKAAWALTGGLAGKIFNFCWNTTFQGFHAGGGQPYTDCAEAVTGRGPNYANDGFLRKKTPIPGSYPSGRDSTDGKEQRPVESLRFSTTPTIYGRHASEDSLTKNNWVFIEQNRPQDHDQSPIRQRSKASMAGSGRYELAQPVRAPASPTASFASPRRTTSAAAVYTRPPGAGKRSRASVASPSRRQTSLAVSPSSPASPEIESYQRKRRKEDRRQDQSLRRLNAHLQDMIREGQQALGSKIEIVDDHDTDEGYFDDEVR